MFEPLINVEASHGREIVQLAASEARDTTNAKPAAARVAQMLNLRNIVKSLPLLANALQGSRSELLKIVADVSTLARFPANVGLSIVCFAQMISDERLEKIEQLVRQSLNEEAVPAKVPMKFSFSRVHLTYK